LASRQGLIAGAVAIHQGSLLARAALWAPGMPAAPFAAHGGSRCDGHGRCGNGARARRLGCVCFIIVEAAQQTSEQPANFIFTLFDMALMLH